MTKTVRFDDIVTMYYYKQKPQKDGDFDWMQEGRNRVRFERRIKATSKVITPVLLKHLENIQNEH